MTPVLSVMCSHRNPAISLARSPALNESRTIAVLRSGNLVFRDTHPKSSTSWSSVSVFACFVCPTIFSLSFSLVQFQTDLTPTQITQEKEKAYQLHAERSGKIHNINQLLRAYTLYEKDVEYVIQDGKVMIVDEFTGRVLPGRRYSEGLHQALEAKENVTIERETQTLATITIQNYFRLYDKLSGMTGTAETEAEEFGAIYNLDVTVVPTHTSVIREDRDDLVYKTKREKYNAVIEEISNCHKRGQPVLVGTISVEVSELLSRMLKRKGILHNVLNAKQHQKEAEIVTRAGQSGAITIATNMAGRGTDIKLGSGVKEVSGLHILGTERHDSRRIDLQLRGRSGRQGDPGSSQFYLSLEDDLMRLFGSDRIAGIMDKMGVEEGEVITAKMVTRAISNAQKKVEGRNYGIRKHLLEYDDVMNQQRQVIYDIRNQALHGEDMKETVLEFIEEYVADELESQDSTNPEDWNWESIKQNIASHLLVDADPDSMKSELNKDDLSIDDVRDFIIEKTKNVYAARESLVPEEIMRGFERFVVLRTIDEKWKDHLYSMDQIREGINLRAYRQKDPLLGVFDSLHPVRPHVPLPDCGDRVCTPMYSASTSSLSIRSAAGPWMTTEPFSSTSPSSAMESAMRAFCSTSRIVTPSSRIPWMMSNTCRTRMGAKPNEGSSNSSSRGPFMSARAIASICCSPPESVPAGWDRRSDKSGKNS